MTRLTRALALGIVAVVLLPGTLSSQAQLNSKAVEFTKPGDIKFVQNAAGTQETAVLFGDPAKPGPYVVRLRWLPGNMSRPHSHPNDRFFVVISGTWWLGTGEKYDPNSTVPVAAGTYVFHRGNEIHYDGAKDEPAVIQVWGMGPATSTPAPAEKK
ncbi:MAG TPA: cupin domain-containing protein [Vicinamibacterales bacterium]|nr:cupin domain-containing protein [Vicinamibacterales bacterium]